MRREQRKRPLAVSEVFSEGKGFARFRNRLRIGTIWRRWEEIVGPAIAGHACPRDLSRGTLIVRVDHAVWMQELSLLKPQILSKLQEKTPGITALRLEQGPLSALPPDSRTARPLPPPRPLSAEELEFIDRAVERISDDGVREEARRAMGTAFARQRPGPTVR